MNKTILFGAVVLSLLALFGYKSNAQIKEENNTVKNETPKKSPKQFINSSAETCSKLKPKEAIPKNTAQ